MAEENNSVSKNIKRIIEQNKAGSLFNYNDFKSCGSYTAIRTAIVDLCKAKYLERICQGVYVKPGTEKDYIPDNITLAIEIDRKNGSIATPKGKTLDFLEGRISKMPTVLNFFSTGSSRTRKLPDGTTVKYTLQRKRKSNDTELYNNL